MDTKKKEYKGCTRKVRKRGNKERPLGHFELPLKLHRPLLVPSGPCARLDGTHKMGGFWPRKPRVKEKKGNTGKKEKGNTEMRRNK